MLDANTLLRLSDFSLQVAGDSVYLSAERHASVPFRPDILELLQMFTEPRTLGDAAAHASTAHDWIRWTHAILALVDAGVLIAEEQVAGDYPGVHLDEIGFGGAREHISMLDDRARTHSYLEAIRSSVKPDDVVLDLGCGTGVLAAAAAQCGAHRVHAVERSRIADAASVLFSNNVPDERVLLHRTISTRLELNEPADLLVTELVGNEPLSERILEYVLDARRRLLKPGFRIIPRSIDIAVQCLQLPAGFRDQHLFTESNTSRWTRDYGLDFSVLKTLRTMRPLPVTLPGSTLDASTPISDNVTIHSIDLSGFVSPTLDCTMDISLEHNGAVDAVCVTFELHLDAERTIGNTARLRGADGSWSCRAWLAHEPVSARRGDTLTIRYRHTPIGSDLDFSGTAV